MNCARYRQRLRVQMDWAPAPRFSAARGPLTSQSKSPWRICKSSAVYLSYLVRGSTHTMRMYGVDAAAFLLGILLTLLASSASAFLWDREVAVVNSPWAPFPVAVRHVEFIGVKDNGTLDCSTPGFREYEWRLFDKTYSGFYAKSSELFTTQRIRKHQSRVEIGKGSLNLNGDILVAMCSPLLDSRPRLRIIWVITRLHSPVGYPTDPRVCEFGAKSSKRSCDWYRLHHSTDCYFGKGSDYKGGHHYVGVKYEEECLSWWLARLLPLSHSAKEAAALLKRGLKHMNHNFCRRIGDDGHSTPWCYTGDVRKPKASLCTIPGCSTCIYGQGNGKFSLYPKQRFPSYQGLDLFVVDKTSRGEHLQCVVGQTCKSRNNGKPSCQIKDESGQKRTAQCFLKQCTVRLVWFLFFDAFGRSYVDQSNADPVELTLVEGRKNQRIEFGAFGIHLTSSFIIGTDQSKLVKYAKQIRVIGRTPSQGLSELVFDVASGDISGVYYVQYQFVEADPEIETGTHRAKFRVAVKKPMRFSLKPELLKVCHRQSGTFRLRISGAFDFLEGSIRWSAGNSSKHMKEIQLDHKNFQLSKDLLSLTAKNITGNLLISTEGEAFSGKTSAKARVEVKGRVLIFSTFSMFPTLPPVPHKIINLKIAHGFVFTR